VTKINITVPDLGGGEDLEIIEVLVAPGDSVAAEAGLICVESDKSTMEIPSPQAGKVVELKVQLGDAANPDVAPDVSTQQRTPEATPVAPNPDGETDCDLIVIGSGPVAILRHFALRISG